MKAWFFGIAILAISYVALWCVLRDRNITFIGAHINNSGDVLCMQYVGLEYYGNQQGYEDLGNGMVLNWWSTWGWYKWHPERFLIVCETGGASND